MTVPRTLPSLRGLLLLDAAACLAMGLALALGAGALAALTGIPQGLLLYAGFALLPIAAFMAVAAYRSADWPWAVWLVIVGNELWVVASLWLVVDDVIAPNGLGYTVLVAQAAAVAALALLEYRAMRRSTAAVTA